MKVHFKKADTSVLLVTDKGLSIKVGSDCTNTVVQDFFSLISNDEVTPEKSINFTFDADTIVEVDLTEESIVTPTGSIYAYVLVPLEGSDLCTAIAK